MKGSLTEEDWERINEFTSAAPYDRGPDMLVPEENGGEGDERHRDLLVSDEERETVEGQNAE